MSANHKSLKVLWRNLSSGTKNICKLDPDTQKVTVYNIPEITKEKIKEALGQMKKCKAPNEEEITCEMLKMGGYFMKQILQRLFNKC